MKWDMVPLGDFMVRRGGSVSPSAFPDEQFELYSIPAHDRGKPDLVFGSEVGSSKQLVRPGDVMISKIVPHIRRSRVVGSRSDNRQIASGEWIVFRTNRVDPSFLRHYLMSDYFHLQFMRTVAGVGGSLLRARPSEVSKLAMPMPPIEEQRRIAAILDHADTIRAKRRQVLAHLDTLARAIFQDMFNDRPADVIVESVVERSKGSIRTGPFGSQLLHGEFVEDGVAVLGLDNVVGNRFRWAGRRYITPKKYKQLARYTVRAGDVLISIMGTTGRCVVVPDDIPLAITTKHICSITLDQKRVLPEFVRAAFLWHRGSKRHLRQQTKGSIMDGLNMGIIRTMPLPVPPVELQRKFVQRSTGLDACRSAVQAALGLDDELFLSLQSRAFRGQL